MRNMEKRQSDLCHRDVKKLGFQRKSDSESKLMFKIESTTFKKGGKV